LRAGLALCPSSFRQVPMYHKTDCSLVFASTLQPPCFLRGTILDVLSRMTADLPRLTPGLNSFDRSSMHSCVSVTRSEPSAPCAVPSPSPRRCKFEDHKRIWLVRVKLGRTVAPNLVLMVVGCIKTDAAVLLLLSLHLRLPFDRNGLHMPSMGISYPDIAGSLGYVSKRRHGAAPLESGAPCPPLNNELS
jgi:hypothetical protein